MTPEEREKMNEICKRIQTERNPEIFDQLVRELNDLLEIKHERIHPEHKCPRICDKPAILHSEIRAPG